MKGLLLKDFYIIREGFFILILVFIAVGGGLAFLISPWVLIIIAATTLSMQATTTIHNDKATQWNKVSVTLPVSRSQIVKSKYLEYLLLCIIGIVLGAIVSTVASLFRQSFDINNLFVYSGIAILVSLLSGSVGIPCAFFLNEDKSIFGVILSYFVTAGLFVGLVAILKQFMNIQGNLFMICGIAATFSIAAFALSWLICPKRIAHMDI